MTEETEVVETEDYVSEDAEAKASEMGWAPKDEWRGDPEKWVDAQTFLERGEKSNGILKERNDKLVEEVQALKRELRESVKSFGDATRKAEERAYKKAISDLKAQQMAAVQEGNTDEWARLEREKDSLEKEFQPQQQEYNPDNDPVFKEWHSENDWYLKDIEQTAYAEQVASIIARRHNITPNNPPSRAFYDEIAAEVKKKFSHNHRNANRDAPGAVQGASQGGGKPKKGKGYSDLPPEAKMACDKYVKEKLLTKEQYVKSYFGE